MEFLDKILLFVKSKRVLLFVLLAAVINLSAFAYFFGFHKNNDTESYIISINFFRGDGDEIYPNRYLNPFYSLVAASIFNNLSPEDSIILTNIIFYFGLVLLTYGLLKRVFKSEFIGAVSSLFVMTSYAFIRYGLTQVQDMGGYFWYVLIVYVSWRWWEDKKNYWLYLGGVGVSFAMLTKESGCMAALFFAALLLLSKLDYKNKFYSFVRFSFLPLITLFVNQVRGSDMAYNSKDWFVGNWITYAHDNYTLIKWLGVNISTYNFLWLLFFIGFFLIIKKIKTISFDVRVYLGSILLPSLSYFAWPVFISRTVFISAWFFVPVASYAVYYIYMRGQAYKYLAGIIVFLAVVSPYILQNTLRYAHVFYILDQCNKNIVCGWRYFWDNRNSFSKEL